MTTMDDGTVCLTCAQATECECRTPGTPFLCEITPITAPSHTDLMVPPESIDAFMEADPLPEPPITDEEIEEIELMADLSPFPKSIPRLIAALRASRAETSALKSKFEFEPDVSLRVYLGCVIQPVAKYEADRADADARVKAERERCTKIVEAAAQGSGEITVICAAEDMVAAISDCARD